jgi:hypothetical protein
MTLEGTPFTQRDLNNTECKDSATLASGSRLRSSMSALIGLDEHIFDSVEQSVTYLVRTNTWPRYLNYLKKTTTVPSTSLFPLRFHN